MCGDSIDNQAMGIVDRICILGCFSSAPLWHARHRQKSSGFSVVSDVSILQVF
jgi:hypothetical protein